MISYAFNSLWESNKLPRFGAHIKTGSCVLKNPEGVFNYTEDGDRKSNQELRFELKKKMLSAIPGEHLDLKNTSHSTNEIFKIQALPRGESARELSKSQLPLIKRASTEEFKDLFQVLRENAELRTTYLVLMVLSTTLATFGLFADSTPVVIGAMILAPLMSPIISLSMGALRQDKNLIFSSTNTILTGLGICILFAIFITLITPIKNPNSEILSRTNPNLLDLGIAVISGIAGAYAHAREEVAKTLAGVAIAVALVPPLVVAGIGLGWMDWSVFSGALLLLLTNLAGMVLAASVTFMLLGFSPFRLATKAVFLSLILVGAFSVPLGLGFNRMVYKHKVIQNLNGFSIGDITIKDVSVQSVKPLTISIRIVANERVDNDKLREIKNQIEEKLNNEVELEITTSMKF
ncbi:MAG: TIGR00341 family protein [Flavobacteriales bacterium]|nr:MAG: TIGR00341 family protein [Flavobacteriales bacterium]